MGEEQWWEEEGDEWEHTHSPTEDKGEKEEEEERPLKSLTLGSKTEREIENDFGNAEQRRKTHKQECEITNSGTKGKARCTENTHRKRFEGVEATERRKYEREMGSNRRSSGLGGSRHGH